MAKSKKKRKLNNFRSLEGTHNIVGLDETNSENDLFACLSEFQQTSKTETTDNLEDQQVQEKGADSWEEWHVDREKLNSWNSSFQSWLNTGNYTPNLLPSIDEELARHFHVQELSKLLLKQGKDIRMPVFERWLLDSRMEDHKRKDPVLPNASGPSSMASQRLVQELKQQNDIPHEQATRVVAELCLSANRAGQQLLAQKEQYRRSSPIKKGDLLEVKDDGTTKISFSYKRKKWKKPFFFGLNKEHYDKLKTAFFRVHNSASIDLNNHSKKVLRGFHIIILALLLRYSSLSGGQLLQDLRGGGMQGAVHEAVFQALEDSFGGTWVEGFASPFNNYCGSYGSVFSDLDWHFGSIGSFFDVSFIRKNGCYCEANPPFSPGLITSMVDHMDSQLVKANRKGTGLTFVVILPTAVDTTHAVHKNALESFQRLITNEHCRKHIRLPARQHGYVEGAQHLRPTRYKQSSYDTSVVLLQSQVHMERELDMNDFERKIKVAFQSRHDQEMKERRKQGATEAS